MSNIIIRTKTIKGQHHHYLSIDIINEDEIAPLFNPSYLQEKDMVFAEAEGRATATMFNWLDKQLVLKEYCRGGLAAKFSDNKYIYTGLKQTRVYKEFVLLQKMAEMGLPVSTPCFAVIIQEGFFYQAKIISQYISDSISLADVLETKMMSDLEWKQIGVLIQTFHNKQIFHSDLNARNILLVNEKGYLIDFDQSCERKGSDWKQKNIDRLKRSLLKIQKRSSQFYFNEQNWQQFLEGYNATL